MILKINNDQTLKQHWLVVLCNETVIAYCTVGTELKKKKISLPENCVSNISSINIYGVRYIN